MSDRANGTKISSVAVRKIIKDDVFFVMKESKFHREVHILSDDFRIFYIIKKLYCYSIIIGICKCCLAFRDFRDFRESLRIKFS